MTRRERLDKKTLPYSHGSKPGANGGRAGTGEAIP